MKPETLSAICDHAMAEYPREACGLVIVRKGRESYRICRNTASDPCENFILSPQDYAEAEDRGDIIAVVHSHPDAPARASDADKVGCEASGLPWYIVSVLKDGDAIHVGQVNQIEPCGYQAPLVGREFHHGVLDCWSLCRDWYARERGLELPNPPREDGWWDDGHSDLYRDNLEAAGFVPVTESLAVGDMILMSIRSKNHVPNHAAIYIGDGHMIHHMYGRLSTREVYGGWYRECTRMVVRHRSMMDV